MKVGRACDGRSLPSGVVRHAEFAEGVCESVTVRAAIVAAERADGASKAAARVGDAYASAGGAGVARPDGDRLVVNSAWWGGGRVEVGKACGE